MVADASDSLAQRIEQGDLHWIELNTPVGSGPGFRRPCVVVQNDVFNQSRLGTVVICTLTSNLRRAAAPGNVELREGEGGLPKASVVNVTQLYTVDKRALGDRIGKLSGQRVREIFAGMTLVLEPTGRP